MITLDSKNRYTGIEEKWRRMINKLYVILRSLKQNKNSLGKARDKI